jgi:hypothetical protein
LFVIISTIILKTTQYAAISLTGDSGLVPVNYVQAVITPTLSQNLTEEEEIGVHKEKIEMIVVWEKEKEDTAKEEMRERERERARERIPPSSPETYAELDVSEVDRVESQKDISGKPQSDDDCSSTCSSFKSADLDVCQWDCDMNARESGVGNKVLEPVGTVEVSRVQSFIEQLEDGISD